MFWECLYFKPVPPFYFHQFPLHHSFSESVFQSLIYSFNIFCKFPFSPQEAYRQLGTMGIYTSANTRCCHERVAQMLLWVCGQAIRGGFREQGHLNRSWKGLQMLIIQPSGKSHSRKSKSKCIRLEIPVPRKESFDSHLNLFSILLNFPSQGTYLGSSADQWAFLRICPEEHCLCKMFQ